MARFKYMLICSLLLLLAACEKDTEPINFAPRLTTGNATNIYRKGATLSGSIQPSGTSTVQSYGILFSELQSMAEFTEHAIKDTAQNFTVDIQNLTPNTTYYYCAYANSSYSLAKGEVKSFTTTESNAPVFAEVTLGQKDARSCTVSTTIIDDGGSELIMGGFCWSLASEGEPTIESAVLNISVKNGSLSATIKELLPETEYNVRAYAVNANGIGYSKSLVVTTDESTTPVLSSVTPKDSADFSITVEAQVISSGTSAISKAGFCWSTTNETPTVEDSLNDMTSQLTDANAILSSSFTDLTPGTTYYIRAYVTNEQGTSYSEVYAFTTADAKAPTLSAITEKESSDFSVTVEASVTDAGTSVISKAGFCWSTTNETPTVDDSLNDMTSQLTDANAILSSSLTDLTPGTTYYIRAYATNEQGTSYSEVYVFTTADAKAPTLSAITEKESSDFSVTVEASVTDAGTSVISKAGFCWSTTNETPTVEDSLNDMTSQLTDANAILSSSLMDLTPGTTYYIRAYATNEQGTSYSEVYTFTTADAKAPTLSAITEKESSDFSVTVEASVTDAGTSVISKAGFCWSTTNETPTVEDSLNDMTSQLTDANAILSSSLTDLTPNTTYYIRAYATNEHGTSYSEVFTFKTNYKDAGNGNTGVNTLPTTKWE